jgi:hypothetical protein
MFWQRSLPTVTFATTVWERDWRQILLDKDYLKVKQIENHLFPFNERLLVINNVKDVKAVQEAASAKVKEGVLTRYVIAPEVADETMDFFQLRLSDFVPSLDTDVKGEWLYYNALGPLTAIYECRSDYLLYHTGDVYLEKPVSWIPRALRRLEKVPSYKVANLTWNENYEEAKREAERSEFHFYVSKRGFSDQQFLIKREAFRKPIYGEIRPDSEHFPRGDVWEKRVFSYLLNRGLDRITYKRGSYTHKNF